MSKVSIIIPIYNVENHIRKTIESVINQTEKDIEIILVDDGSTDSSGLICDEYASIDHRIITLHKENGGLSSARNAGTGLAKSEYVMYLDGDDYLALHSVERLLNVLKEYPSDFIQFQYQEVLNNQEVDIKEKDFIVYQAKTSKELFENLYHLGGVAASGATKLIRKDLMLKVPFVSIRHEDEMWCTQAFENSLTATYIPDVLYFYVMRQNSIIHSSFNITKLDIFTIIKKRIEVLEKLQFTQFLRFEYERMFISILTLYCEASKVKNDEALDKIKHQFVENKNAIRKYTNLSNRLNIILKLMNLNYCFIKLYDFYSRR